ncbi:hypothetical protein CSIM01_12968 [Colletotrichum simmondsii]|uniref:Uncharacterized protein n=1 Tax=Colletotrichum simmondsii TaxID=703756 RepID=A0A135RQN4_9PEZI|nr:hypothetical protein CSIM01_12968 [Colletotrichum simmondsii]
MSHYRDIATTLCRDFSNAMWQPILDHLAPTMNPLRHVLTEHDGGSAGEMHLFDAVDRLLDCALGSAAMQGPASHGAAHFSVPIIQTWAEASLSDTNAAQRLGLRADRIYARALKRLPTDPAPIPDLNPGNGFAPSRCFMVCELKAHHALDPSTLVTFDTDAITTRSRNTLSQASPPECPANWDKHDWWLVQQASAYACLYRTRYVVLFCWGKLYLFHFKDLDLPVGVSISTAWENGVGINCDFTCIENTGEMVAALFGFAIEAYNNTPRDHVDGP